MQNKKHSLDTWNKYGKYVFMTHNFNDNLIHKAKGTIITDTDNNEILDFSSGQFCSILGHNHPELIKNIKKQINKVLHTGSAFLTLPVLKAACKVAKITPGNLEKVIFLSTGTEANECAFRIAKKFTEKSGIAGFDEGYSGNSSTMQSISSNLSQTDKRKREKIKNKQTILTPHCLKCPVNKTYPGCDFLCLKESEKNVGKGWKNIAAIIVEPILSQGGIIMPPKGYMQALQKLAKKYKVLLIVDEAQTGFGRTGKWFGIEHHSIVPDILVFSKTAGGGYPVSGIVTTEKIARKTILDGFVNISSHQFDPLQGISVESVIDIIKNKKLIGRSRNRGAYLEKKLIELKNKHSIILDVRGIGLMLGFEIKDNSKNIYSLNSIGNKLKYECMKNGLYLNYGASTGTVFRMYPPITVTKKEIEKAISILDKSLTTISKRRYSKKILLPKNPYSRLKIRKSMRERLGF
ncbi:aspartate aminotransferase family protein [Candidatus Woesearchaeota archaeon]|nr:aspartate aminotransferase family protein [Candidatus Woesearchaeota archaeon]